MKKTGCKILLLLFLVLPVLVTGGCASSGEERFQASFLELFDTVTQVVGYAENEKTFSQNVDLIYKKLEYYHQLYDIYTDYEGINNIKTINDNAGIAPVKVDGAIIDLLEMSAYMYEMTQGEVNVAFGPVLRLWHREREKAGESPESARLPDMAALEEAAGLTDFSKVIIDRQASTVYLEEAGMSLDVGAIAKGYATERVAEYMEGLGMSRYMLSVGGNVRTIGSKLGERGEEVPWAVGIQNPNEDGKESNLYILNMKDASLVTSGVYERYYTVDGKRYHHIIDKDTLMPGAYYASVSIVCRDSGLADGLSTAVFNMSPEEGQALIASLENTEALWVYEDGHMVRSEGFDAWIKK